jgi:hypothetical protein
MIPPVESDRGNLQQIFLNLINNAVAAMDDGGRLDDHDRPPWVDPRPVTVADTGHGIPESDLKRVFEPFFSTGNGHGGPGLGLSVTYGMVSEMGGEITVSSQVNQGTRFMVTLPLEPPRGVSPAACAVNPQGRSDAEGQNRGKGGDMTDDSQAWPSRVRFFGEISASISHEIKNVLAIINENAGLLQDMVMMMKRACPFPRNASRSWPGPLPARWPGATGSSRA